MSRIDRPQRVARPASDESVPSPTCAGLRMRRPGPVKVDGQECDSDCDKRNPWVGLHRYRREAWQHREASAERQFSPGTSSMGLRPLFGTTLRCGETPDNGRRSQASLAGQRADAQNNFGEFRRRRAGTRVESSVSAVDPSARTFSVAWAAVMRRLGAAPRRAGCYSAVRTRRGTHRMSTACCHGWTRPQSSGRRRRSRRSRPARRLRRWVARASSGCRAQRLRQ